MVQDGNYIYIVGSAFDIIDISYPGNPVHVSSHSFSGSELLVEDGLAYVVSTDLQILNVTNPNNVALLGSAGTISDHGGMALVGDILYVGRGSWDYFQIFDISNPTSPSLLGTHMMSGPVWDIEVQGDIAYVIVASTGLYTLNITNPENPTSLGSLSFTDPISVKIDGDIAYVASFYYVYGVNIVDPTNMVELQRAYFVNTVYRIDIGSEFLVGVITPGNIKLFTVRDEITYTLRDSFTYSSTSINDVLIHGDTAFASTNFGQVFHYNITDLDNIASYGSSSVSGSTGKIAIHGNLLYSVSDNNFKVLNITDPTLSSLPIETSITDTNSHRGVVVIGDYLYVSNDTNGISIYNITTPETPKYIKDVLSPISGSIGNMEQYGKYLFLGGYSGEPARLVNITNPLNPSILDSFITNGNQFAVTDQTLFIASTTEIVSYGISDPTSVTTLDTYSNPATPLLDIELNHNYLYAAFVEDGIARFDVSNPSNMIVQDVISSENAFGLTYYAGHLFAGLEDTSTGIESFTVFEVSPSRTRTYNQITVAQSNTFANVGADFEITKLTLTATDNTPAGTSHTYQVSADWINWQTVTLGVETTLDTPYRYYGWRVVMQTTDITITSSVSQVDISYSYQLSSPPTLVSPSDTSITKDTTPTFEWNTVTSASNYQLQLDMVNTFGSDSYRDYTVDGTTHTPASELADGIWYWRVAGLDSEGDPGPFSSTWSIVIDSTQPAITPSSSTIDMETGTTGNSFTWTLNDLHPSVYNVTRDGNLHITDTSWIDGDLISIDLDGLEKGTYSYTMYAYDEAGNIGSDIVTVNVDDGINPVVDSPEDISYKDGSTGNTITWTVSDNYPDHYNITLDGAEYNATTAWTTSGSITTNIDELSIGTYVFEITIVDQSGNWASDAVNVDVVDLSFPDLSQPEDIEYKQEETGNSITWDVGDRNPYEYNITLDDVLVVEKMSWINGTITYNVDGLTDGIYTYTIYLMDGDGNVVTDSVIVTVLENIPPEITSGPYNIYVYQYETISLSWYVIDSNPWKYNVTIDDALIITNQDWTSGSIFYEFYASELDSYIVELTVSDVAGNTASYDQNLTVVDNIVPDINSPADISFEEGSTGNQLSWTVSDPNPTTYNITLDGQLYQEGTWSNGTIDIDLDSLTEGEYVFILYLDDEGGNWVSDEVIVTVTAAPDEQTTTSVSSSTTPTTTSSETGGDEGGDAAFLNAHLFIAVILVLPIVTKIRKSNQYSRD